MTRIQKSVPIWAVQGRRFEKQSQIWAADENKDGLSLTKEQAEAFLEEESLSLEERYRPRPQNSTIITSEWDLTNPAIQKIIQRCKDYNSLDFNAAMLSEEQERELAPEIEQERTLERPQSAIAHKHVLSSEVLDFATTGKLDSPMPRSFMSAFKILKATSDDESLLIYGFDSTILVTRDFVRTVQKQDLNEQAVYDDYQRAVQWILTSKPKKRSSRIKHVVIISPFEAHELASKIERNGKTTLHLYSARTSPEHPPVDDLNLYTLGAAYEPSNLSDRQKLLINLFAGQLYLSSYNEYTTLCDFLGLAWQGIRNSETLEADGFIYPPRGTGPFTSSPVRLLKRLMMTIRRNGREIGKTHMGRILNGELLTKEDFEQ